MNQSSSLLVMFADKACTISRIRCGIRALVLLAFAALPLHAEDRAAIHKFPPAYPPMAKQLRITGTVKVVATVDPSGTVVKAESDSGNKMLAPSAIDAVKHWKFAPGSGTDTITVTVNFEL